MERLDCKTCKHAKTLYGRIKDDRFQATYTPTGFVRCSGPRYRGRAFFCRDSKEACGDYERTRSFTERGEQTGQTT